MLGRRLDSWVLVLVVLFAVVACSGPLGPGGASGESVVVTDEAVVVTLPSGGTVTIPPLPAGESAVVTVEESALPFAGEFAPLEWLTAAVSLSADDDGEWAEDAVVQLSLPLSGSPAVSTQAFEVGNSVGIIRIVGAPDDVFGPSTVLYGMPRLNASTGYVDLDVPAGLMLSSTGVNARDVQVRIAGNVVEFRKNFWPAQEGLWRVVPSKVPLERDDFVDACRLNSLDDLLTKDLRGPSSTAVVMVHGWQTLNQFLVGGDNINNVVHCKDWLDVMAAFQHEPGDWQDLREHADLFTFRYNSDMRIVESGAKLANAVDDLYDLGYGTVVLLGHSMGGLVSVEARQQLAYPAYLAGIVTLGTPFMGGVIDCIARRTLVAGPNPEPESYCILMRDGPISPVTGILDFIAPAGGTFDLTQHSYLPAIGTVANPYLTRLWDGESSPNFANIAAIYGNSSIPAMSATVKMKTAIAASWLWYGASDGAVPTFSAVASLEGRVSGEDPLVYSELTYRLPVAVGRDHGQLLHGCTNCANGRQGNPTAYDPYFNTIVNALLEFVPIGSSPPTAPASAIAAGGHFSLALRDDGTLSAWGWNVSGQLGDGTTNERRTPVQVSGLTSVASISTGLRHSLALRTDGTVWAWGWNVRGQLGDGTRTDRLTAVEATGLTSVIGVAAGSGHSMALRADGTVWAWGYNYSGQLGDGSTTDRLIPSQVVGLTNVISITSQSSHSLALRSDGTVWAWGDNQFGQLGDGTTANRLTPVQVSGLTDVLAIAAGGGHSLALRTDGTVWAWGQNGTGQLGDGTTTDRYVPVTVSGLANVTSVVAGPAHSLVVRTDGTAWAWGSNEHGTLGDGTTMDRQTPVHVSGLTAVTSVTAGYYHSMAVRTDGTVWAWGYNGNGQLGDGTTNHRVTPGRVSAF